MNQITRLDEKQLKELVEKLAHPTFNYFIKRMQNEIFNKEKFESMDLNDLFNIIVSSQASVDANILRWMQAFNKIKTNTEIDFMTLKQIFFMRINEQLKLLQQ